MIKGREGKLGADNEDILQIKHELASNLKVLGEYEEAKELD